MKQAILIEGLFSYGAGFVRNVYQKPLEDMGYKVTSLPWTADIPDGADVIISHSFGAGYAVIKNPACKLFITLDARSWLFWNNSSYEKPKGVREHYNFFQSGMMRGYPINGAINQEVRASHIGLPKACFNYVMGILNNKETK